MIKSYLRSTMSDNRLSALSIFSVERDYVHLKMSLLILLRQKPEKFNFEAAIDILFD